MSSVASAFSSNRLLPTKYPIGIDLTSYVGSAGRDGLEINASASNNEAAIKTNKQNFWLWSSTASDWANLKIRDLTATNNLLVSGNVGIGTISPSTKLEVIGNTHFVGGVGIGINPSWGLDVEGRIGVEGISYTMPGITTNSIYEPGYQLGDITKLQFDSSGTERANIRAVLTAAGSASPVDTILSSYTGSALTDKMIIKGNTGNIGIGTSPSYKLDVAGNANAQQLCILGDCRSSWAAATSGTSGWAVSGSSVYNTSANVGIGTSSPARTLDVNGAVKANDIYITQGGIGEDTTITSEGNWGLAISGISNGAASLGVTGYAAISGKLAVGQIATPPSTTLDVNGDASISGKVGIGTNSPTSNLHIKTTYPVAVIEETAAATWYPRLYLKNPQRTYLLQGSSDGRFIIWDDTAGATRLGIDSGGAVGIGMNPASGAKLDVNGNTMVYGDIDIGGVYRRGTAPGQTQSCPAGQTFSGITSSGGILTQVGSCISIGGGGGAGWATSGSNVYNTSANVGIGTASPAVSGLHIGSGVSGGQAQLRLDNSNGQYGGLNRWTDRLELMSSNAIGLSAGAVGSSQLWLTNGGNVGIGTSNPQAQLDVANGARFHGGLISTTGDAGYGPLNIHSWGLGSSNDIYLEPPAGKSLHLTDSWSKTGTLDIQFGTTTISNNLNVGGKITAGSLDTQGQTCPSGWSCEVNTWDIVGQSEKLYGGLSVDGDVSFGGNMIGFKPTTILSKSGKLDSSGWDIDWITLDIPSTYRGRWAVVKALVGLCDSGCTSNAGDNIQYARIKLYYWWGAGVPTAGTTFICAEEGDPMHDWENRFDDEILSYSVTCPIWSHPSYPSNPDQVWLMISNEDSAAQSYTYKIEVAIV
jgi:hypothetical protein